MTQRFLFLIACLCFMRASFAQQPTIVRRLDSLLSAPTDKPFNGVVVINSGGKIIYKKASGYADFAGKKPIADESEFVIGSISKQITAVIVLQEMEKGHLRLNDPIHKYLPELTEAWADTVTIHHLLTHTHGITGLNRPPAFGSSGLDSVLAFQPGSRFAYGFIGYDLLSKIVEKTSGQSFPELCTALFEQCGMQHSFHPRTQQYKHLAQGYVLDKQGKPELTESVLDLFAAAGGLIASADDLAKWNNCLHSGKLLSDSTYRLMIAPKENAFRDHVILGKVDYGYGITIPEQSAAPELVVTGVAPGYISMDLYFPATKTSVIVLENIARDMQVLRNSFYYHDQVLKIVIAVQ